MNLIFSFLVYFTYTYLSKCHEGRNILNDLSLNPIDLDFSSSVIHLYCKCIYVFSGLLFNLQSDSAPFAAASIWIENALNDDFAFFSVLIWLMAMCLFFQHDFAICHWFYFVAGYKNPLLWDHMARFSSSAIAVFLRLLLCLIFCRRC